MATIVDAEDEPKLSEYRWHASPNTMGGYYVVAHPKLSGRRTTIYLHRLIMAAPDGLQVDHINHDTLDNRRANLRIVTNQVNNANRAGPYTTNKTGVRGLSMHRGERYVVRCAIVTCPVARYFPLSEFEEARAFAEAHFAGEPIPPRPRRPNNGALGKSGVPGVLVSRHRSRDVYEAKCQGQACPVRKSFPYTPAGLEAAQAFLQEHDAQTS